MILIIAITAVELTTKCLKKNRRKEEIKVERKLNLKLNFDTPHLINLPIFSSSILKGYSSCSSEMEADLIEASKYIATDAIEMNIKNGITDGPRPVIMYATAPAPSSPGEGGGASGMNEDSYTTNNQIDGVDEADSVKSDGNNVFVLYGNEVIVLSVEGRILDRTKVPDIEDSSVQVDYWNVEKDKNWGGGTQFFPYFKDLVPRGLLLDGNHLVVIVSSYFYGDDHPKLIGSETTAAFIYSINTDGKLQLVDRKNVRGRYENARSIGGQVYIVSNTYIDTWQLKNKFDRYNEEYWFMTDDEYKVAASIVLEEALPKFAKQLMAELLGDADNFGVVEDSSCNNFLKLFSNDGSNILSSFAQVNSFNMHSTISRQMQKMSGVFMPSSDLEIYASNEMLIFAGRIWDKGSSSTFLVGFDLQANGVPIPSATGKVPGYLLNQFSIDYYNNHLRIATTINARWGLNDITDEWEQVEESKNQVYVLKKQGDEFMITGSVEDLGITERIYSVRFLGERGFIVTFKVIDPLYTLNLSDPFNPYKVGELKIPGYSNYLHPVEDKYLLAVGQDVDVKSGALTGLQISLFDVSDLSNPLQVQKKVIRGSSSDAQYDHHAFRYLPLSKVLILPVSNTPRSKKDTFFDGFHVYNIEKDWGIKKLGEVIHADNSLISFYNCFSSAYMSPRSLVFSSNLMTLKGHTILMNENLTNPNKQWLLNLDAGYSSQCSNWFPWS